VFNTTIGSRVLRGAEATLFAKGMLDLLEIDISAEDEYDNVNLVFCSLTREQKVHGLHTALQALFMEDIAEPPRSAAYDSVIDVVFQRIKANIAVEIDMAQAKKVSTEADYCWRDMVLRAAKEPPLCDEVFGSRHEKGRIQLTEDDLVAGLRYWPARLCEDKSEWEFLLDELEWAILKDQDWEMYETFIDMPADKARAMAERFNIQPEYFTTIAEDPSPEIARNLFVDAVLFLGKFLGYEDLEGDEVLY